VTICRLWERFGVVWGFARGECTADTAILLLLGSN